MKSFYKALIVILFFSSSKGIAQDTSKTDYKKFSKSFLETVYYPIETKLICKPVECLLKIEIDASKKILEMRLSDSADTLLKERIDLFNNKIDTKSLTSFIKSQYPNTMASTYVIPVHLSTRDDSCTLPMIESEKLFSYFRFKGSFLIGPVIILLPIYSASTVLH